MSQVLLAAGGAWQLAWTLAVVFVAYALRGATGFGAGVVSIPLLLLALPLPVVIPLVTAMGMLASFGQALHQRRWVDWATLRHLVVPSVLGVAAGLWLFSALDPDVLLRALAVFIIGYALWGYLPRRAARPAPAWLGPLAGALGGFVATVFGGMAGPLYVVYLRSFALDKTRFRATVAVALLCLSALRALGYGGLGLYDARVLWLLAAAVPVVALAMIAGDRWHARLDEARFGHVVAALLVLSGAALLLK
ncbi:MAG: sulfite exporter TauE/SafE family protein [Betaproteobacteria bacterium]|nr:sulfite exporter TauE/SafE family protein [Betaproteobacteria bacterium]